MLSLRQAVRSLIALCSAIEGVRSELLSKIHAILTDERLEVIDQVGRVSALRCQQVRALTRGPLTSLQLIADRLEQDTGQPDRKKTGLAQRNAKIWAVKASHSRLLDVARETYKENIQDIIELVQGYQSASPSLFGASVRLLILNNPFATAVYHLPTLSITFGQNLMMIVSEDDVEEGGLPDVFKNVSKKGPKKCAVRRNAWSGRNDIASRRLQALVHYSRAQEASAALQRLACRDFPSFGSVCKSSSTTSPSPPPPPAPAGTLTTAARVESFSSSWLTSSRVSARFTRHPRQCVSVRGERFKRLHWLTIARRSRLQCLTCFGVMRTPPAS